MASLVLRIRPERRNIAESLLSALPGVECHAMSEDGKLVVTVEDTSESSVPDTLVAIHRIPEVLAVTLAFEAGERFSDPFSSDSRSSEEVPS